MVSWLLFGGACLGHTAIAVRSHNWWYGSCLPRLVTTAVRQLHYLAILAGPVVFWLALGFDPLAFFREPPADAWQIALAGYLVACWIVAFLLLPAVTLRRLRPPVAALLSNHTRIIDVAARLGYKPVGRRKPPYLAFLPANEIFQVDFSERTLRLPRLPETWKGLSILHLSDLHLIGTPDRIFFEHVMDLCNDWTPDLVALTGDIVDGCRYHRWIVPVLARLRWRVAAFAILGNHDSWYDPPLVRRRLRRAGMRVLGNTWEAIEVRGEPMVVIGQEGPWFRPEPDLGGCPAGVFRLCLSHTPDNIGWCRRHGVDLMLSGHNHGGQIRLPLVGSVFVPSAYGRRYDCGLFYEPPTLLHVSRGLGEEHPVRYRCRPEATKLILQKGV